MPVTRAVGASACRDTEKYRAPIQGVKISVQETICLRRQSAQSSSVPTCPPCCHPCGRIHPAFGCSISCSCPVTSCTPALSMTLSSATGGQGITQVVVHLSSILLLSPGLSQPVHRVRGRHAGWRLGACAGDEKLMGMRRAPLPTFGCAQLAASVAASNIRCSFHLRCVAARSCESALVERKWELGMHAPLVQRQMANAGTPNKELSHGELLILRLHMQM